MMEKGEIPISSVSSIPSPNGHLQDFFSAFILVILYRQSLSRFHPSRLRKDTQESFGHVVVPCRPLLSCFEAPLPLEYFVAALLAGSLVVQCRVF